ncbi:MAG: thiamine-phosphate kinase [Betaproteobacteria bacterium]|nr:thiamine-phosphate kinase [Betaproteobacteria bacterium]
MTSEFEIIRRYLLPATRHTVLAGGDDAALLRPSQGQELAVSTDMLVEGVHFLPDTDPVRLGHKSLAVNLSDLAAMGAMPRWAFLALSIPAGDDAWVEAFARGFLRLAGDFDVDLAGGDTTRGPRNICVTVVGEVPAGTALRRSGARVGDDVWLSGATGEAAFGLLVSRGDRAATAGDAHRGRDRLECPAPRVHLGLALRGLATAAIDVSDGLLADLGHVCAASGVAARLQWCRLPHSSALDGLSSDDRRRLVLAGGDDYELVFTAAAASRHDVPAAARQAGTRVARIGTILPGSGVTVADGTGRPISLGGAGFDHFG